MNALPICLVVAAGVGATVTTFLGRSVVEQNRVLQESASERAAWRAIGEIELAKNVVMNASYTDGQNDIIQLALASDPPLIPGTPVMIERAGPSRWYRMTSTTDFGGAVGAAECMVRDGLSYTAYNYYVENNNLGISGKPKGRIFTNKSLEFYFAGGAYDGYVSAGEGFTYKSGASEENTTFLRGADRAATHKSLLSAVDLAGLKAEAAHVAPDGLIGEVKFTKTTLQVKLYAPDSTIVVSVAKTKQVQVGTEIQLVAQDVFHYEWQWVSTKKSKKTWIDTTGTVAGGGTDLGGGSGTTGYWLTEYYWEDVWTKVKIIDGTTMVEKSVPIYATETYYVDQTQTVAGALVSTTTYPAAGIFYFPGPLRAIAGDLNGKVTLVTEQTAKITGNLRYIDAQNDLAYLNGSNPGAGDYVPNPAFNRNHALGVIAEGGISYARTAPTSLEINANLVSLTGSVAMEGIVVDANGNPTLSGSKSVKTSLRRFGSVMCSLRPVATLLDANGAVSHGFSSGSSAYDQGALNDPPPGFPNEETLQFLETVRIEQGYVTPAGTTAPDAGVTALTGLKDFKERRTKTTDTHYDWGVKDYRDAVRRVNEGLGELATETETTIRGTTGAAGGTVGTGVSGATTGATGTTGTTGAAGGGA